MKLWSTLRKKMLSHPDKMICENNVSLTYEEMVIFAQIFADKIRTEKCCAILCRNEMATAMALLACFAANVTAVPLSLRYGEQHCRKIIDHIKPTAIINDIDGELNVLRLKDADYKKPNVHPAIIMYTSGTTGIPKGAMLSEDNILANAKDILSYFNITEKDAILISRPLYHCAVLTGEFIVSLIRGLNIRFFSDSFAPQIILELIKKHDINVFCGTPTILNLLAVFNRDEAPASLDRIVISGEKLSKNVATKISKSFPNADIYNVYGLTEACPRVSWLPPEYFKTNPECVGIPLDNVTIKIITDYGSQAKAYEDGILWVKGPNIMMGYYDAPIHTNSILKDGWLCTGDIAMVDSEGMLYIRGRNDDLIIRGGMNIYPGDIESSLKGDPRVKDVLVYGYTERDIVKIGLKISGNFDSADDVRKMCANALPIHQRPSKIELLDDLPKNGSGKIIRRQ